MEPSHQTKTQPEPRIQLDFLKVNCPNGMPIEARGVCYFNNASGNCERCTCRSSRK